jgi:CBS domain containing-hemolysin-like protein
MSVGVALLVLGLCFLVEGLFSGTEIACVSADRVKLQREANEGNASAQLALHMLTQPERILGACILGTIVATASAATIATTTLLPALFAELGIDEKWASFGAILLVTPMTLLFGEMIPKSVFEFHSDKLVLVVVKPLRRFQQLFLPILWTIERATSLLFRLMGAKGEVLKPVSRESIRSLFEEETPSKAIDDDEKALIRRVFEFADTTVEEVMVPLIEVTAIPATSSIREAAKQMVETGYSRLPVYRERVDQIVGLLFHRDLLFAEELDSDVTSLMTPVSFVPETKRVESLFLEMRRTRRHFSVVVDEYGGASGVITIEDMLEEIVGEIEDEFDQRRQSIHQLGERHWRVSARCEREPLAELGLELPEGDFETLAGFLLARLGRVPRQGESVTWKRWRLTVMRATERGILEVLLAQTPEPNVRASREIK